MTSDERSYQWRTIQTSLAEEVAIYTLAQPQKQIALTQTSTKSTIEIFVTGSK